MKLKSTFILFNFNLTKNAASIAGLLLTTECLITDAPEKTKPEAGGGHGHGGGGMGDMGGMGGY